MLDNLRAGGIGCISASVNVQPRAVRQVYDHWRRNDVDLLQAKVSAVRIALERSGPLIPAVKAMLCEIHGESGWFIPRPPLDPLSEATREKLRAELYALAVDGLLERD